MLRTRLLSNCVPAAVWLVTAGSLYADAELHPIAAYAAHAGPTLLRYCGDCHGGEDAESGVDVEGLRGGEDFQRDRTAWKNVLRRLRAGDMPPQDSLELPNVDRQQLIQWIEAKLDSIDCSTPAHPGRVALRRLNRDQYRRTVRDLLGVEYDPSGLFAPDELAGGFDNNARALSMAPAVFEKYLKSAADVARRAIPSVEQTEGRGHRVHLNDSRQSIADGDARLLFTRGEVSGEFKTRRDGAHAVRVVASGDQAGDGPVQMRVHAGRDRERVFDVFGRIGEEEPFVLGFDAESGDTVEIAVEFLNDYYDATTDADRNLWVEEVRVVSVDAVRDSAPPVAQASLLMESPTEDEWGAGRRWRRTTRGRIEAWLPKAYRGPVTSDDVRRVLRIMERSREAGDSYLLALQTAVRAVLSSSRFLFAGGLESRAGDGVRPIDEYALASRLSYFLWGSMPDAELLRLAERGELRSQMERQVRRMLQDRRSGALGESFAGQWLETRRLLEAGAENRALEDFDTELRDAMIAEAAHFFGALVREDLPITALLDAPFTYVNERLASHYGLQTVSGPQMRRVAWPAEQRSAGRGGVLGMASVLTVMSNPDRTSPVLRGRFVLASLLGEEPPPPPPNIPALVEEGRAAAGTVRERLERHSSDPACAACHKHIDPLGFALEGFDALGRQRSVEAGRPVDDSAVLPGGVELNGAAGLREYLLANEGRFRETMARKLLTYALGRSLTHQDECAVRQIVAATEAGEDRFSAMVDAIVVSRPFLFEGATQGQK